MVTPSDCIHLDSRLWVEPVVPRPLPVARLDNEPRHEVETADARYGIGRQIGSQISRPNGCAMRGIGPPGFGHVGPLRSAAIGGHIGHEALDEGSRCHVLRFGVETHDDAVAQHRQGRGADIIE